jgi:hypothetical protein
VLCLDGNRIQRLSERSDHTELNARIYCLTSDSFSEVSISNYRAKDSVDEPVFVHLEILHLGWSIVHV